MRNALTLSTILFLFAVPTSAQSLDSTAAPDSYGEVVYLQRLTIDPHTGERTTEIQGSISVSLADGTLHTIDQDTLEDPDGNRFSATVDVYQDLIDGPVSYEYRLWRQAPRALTDEEIEAIWMDGDSTVTSSMVADARAQGGSEGLADTGGVDSDTGSGLDYSAYVHPDLESWLSSDGDDSEVLVTVARVESDALMIEDVAWDLAESDPGAFLDSYENRLNSIESRKTDVATKQEEIIEAIESLGAEHTYSYWIVNALDAFVTRDALRYLVEDSDTLYVVPVVDAEEETNSGIEIRSAAGIQQYLDYGYDASDGGMRSANNEVYIGLVDTKIYLTHPAWEDCGDSSSCIADCGSSTCSSRFLSGYEWNGSSWGSMSGLPGSSHGTKVAGQLFADLTDNQDPAYSGTTDQGRKTGMTTEAVFSAVSHGQSAGCTKAIQQAVALGVDNINLSAKCSTTLCTLYDSSNGAANVANLEGVFFTKSAGNEGHGFTSCTATAPGPAAGVFTVGSHEVDSVSNLETADIWAVDPWTGSSRGGDSRGRSVIDLVAAGGREGGNLTAFNDTGGPDYVGNPGGQTSYAAPVIAGAAADFRHYLVDMFSPWPSAWTDRNTAGLVFASMLLMGDGQLESGSMGTGTAYDTLWGAGRLSMKMFNSTGMTAPWRFRLAVQTVYDSETNVIPLNPSESGNQPVPDSASSFRAATWWYEPNLPPFPSWNVASIKTQICNGSSTCYNYSGTGPSKHRVWLGSAIANDTWEMKITGLSVPNSLDSNYHFGYQKRVVYAVFYWEG